MRCTANRREIISNDYQSHLIVTTILELYMDAKFSDPMSEAFTKKQDGATFADARPKSLLKKLVVKYYNGCWHNDILPCGAWAW